MDSSILMHHHFSKASATSVSSHQSGDQLVHDQHKHLSEAKISGNTMSDDKMIRVMSGQADVREGIEVSRELT